MQLEAVGGVPVGDFGLQVGGQVDDMDGAEGAFLGADTAADTQTFGNEGDLGLRSDLNAELSGTDNWARLFTFLAAFLSGSVLSKIIISGVFYLRFAL